MKEFRGKVEKMLMHDTVVPQFLIQRAYVTPERTALSFEGEKWTFRELYEMAHLYAQKLTELGVAEGHVIGINMKNRPEMVFTIHALLLIGAKIVLLNTRLTDREKEWQLEDAQADFLISENEMLLDISVLRLEQLEKAKAKSFEEKKNLSFNQTATIMYTSGTTGKPKAVQQTMGNHYWSAIGSALNLGLRDDDKWLCFMPLFHISGLSILLRSVIYGIETVLQKGFDPVQANEAIWKEKITICSVVTNTLTRMLEDLGERTYPEEFRCMLLGGGSAPMALLKKATDKNTPVFQTYGMTETCSQIVTLAPEDATRKLGSAGKPLLPCEIKIIVDGRIAAVGVPGEIAVKGPNVTPGYLHGRAPESFQDGWFYTGDIGYIDEEGYLFVIDRRSDLIISGGENIYPAEIESVLMEHPFVKEAGVIGLSDDEWGAVPAAVIVPHPASHLQQTEIIEFCESRLARYKIPKKVVMGKELPRNASNKIVRRELINFFS